ncbi:cupin domain-containing protein [Cesiribacter sp. SM1]|uniref:cupin domain-containing protein n=1 Tax=Cesiribacter sp. SM1 TaxID=2861196 RepID=UPI001CD533D0|nr:cupin domain-containing protein [Cesiribacter sp. SM1]
MKNSNIIKAKQGDTFSMMGLKITVKQSAAASGGLISVLEQTVAPGAGSPPHICSGEDKIIYVVTGKFDVLLGHEVHHCTAGDTVTIPRGLRHNFKNAGTRQGKLLVTLTPGGHENFLRELSESLQQAAPGTDTLKTVAARHEVVLG